MFIKSLISKIFGLKIHSEKDWDLYDSKDELVIALAPTDELQEAKMQAFIEDNLDAWTQLFIEENEYSPTDEQIEQQTIIIRYAFEEISSLEDGIIFLVESMYEEEEIPEVIYEIAKAAIAEYINGNLRIVQETIKKQET